MTSSQLTLQDFKAELFKAMSHPTRIRVLERLRAGEQTVSALEAELGIDANAISQHLAVLRSRNIVTTRKDGTSVHYRVSDENIFVVLDATREIFNNHLAALQSMALDDEPVVFRPARARRG